MKKFSLLLAGFTLALSVAVQAEPLTISGKQIRGVPGRNAEKISKAVSLPRQGTIVEAVSGGEGFWIEDDKGVVNEYRNPRAAVGKPLDAGGPYRVYPFLKKDQSEASCTIRVRVP